MSTARTSFLILAALLAYSGIAAAQVESCPAGSSAFDETLNKHMKEKVLDAIPRLASKSEQNSAPAGSGGLVSVLNESGFSSLLSAAFDQSVSSGSEALTVNASPFLLATTFDPEIYYDQSQYEKFTYGLMRRVGVTASFGGRGESFDRDGDGNPDDALDAKSLDDIITWEARFRIWGSRDRRDRKNHTLMHRSASAPLANAASDLGALLLDPRVTNAKRSDRKDCIDDAQWKALLDKSWFTSGLDPAVNSLIESNKNLLDEAEKIDQALLVTAVLTGVQRKSEFGSDKLGASLRAAWLDFSFNFDYAQMESQADDTRVDTFRMALQWERQILTNLSREGVDVALAASVGLFDNSEDVSHNATIFLQGKLEIPISRLPGVTIPLSVSWANHEDLLSSDDEIIGRVGFSIDTSKILDLAGGS